MTGVLDGQVALVTGASRGIGAETAKALAAAGAAVTLAARSADEIDARAADIRAAGGRAMAQPCDVADPHAVEAAVAATVERWGRFDILVNNAGLIDPIGDMAEVDPRAWGAVIDVNLKGVYHGLRAALPRMAAQGSGVVVNVSSGAATSALEGWAHYCAAKAGALMLTRCAQKEYGPRGVTTVGLSPGTVATAMQKTIRESGVNAVSGLDWSAHIPPDWPARAIVWLCAGAATEFAGGDVSLRDEDVRRRVGLID